MALGLSLPSDSDPKKPKRTGNSLGRPSEGMVINRRYNLLRKIGQGGMGVVFEAFDKDLAQAIAIKFLSAQLADEEMVARFKQEVTLSRKFNHPNVIRMHDLGSVGDTKYITMELLEGEDLAAILKRKTLPLQESVGLLVQACQALQVVHDHGVIHRDVKPENLFVTAEGVLKIMDFGIAKRLDAGTGLTRFGTLAGTPQYMSPEQISDFANVTHLADLYALGCIAYQMFTGRVPFDGTQSPPIYLAHQLTDPDPPSARNPQVPPELDAIVLRLLAKQPEERIQSCRELAEMLRTFADLADSK